jgi:hypothetical protein
MASLPSVPFGSSEAIFDHYTLGRKVAAGSQRRAAKNSRSSADA